MSSLIGIPCHALIRAETGRPIYANNRAYVHAVESAGGLPILIPMINDLNILTALLTRLDGLLLPGGIDLHPGRYGDRKSTRLNSSHLVISYAVFCLKKKKKQRYN